MTGHQWLLLAIMAAVVALLRFLPFLCFGGKRPVPPLFLYLGKTLSAAAIAMLVVYGMATVSGGGGSPVALALAALIVVFLQWKIGNPLLSIFAGTAFYMLALQGFLTKLPFL
ncbi:MAG: AzlD domain-containing protein [Victivallaceae bacterium]|nr:AzlD domain-containing protein [Victivallaceae bacterium]